MEKLIKDNEGLVGKVIKDLHCKFKSKEDYEEVYDAGMFGLIVGAKNYDGSSKVSTYLYKCIKNEIVRLFTYRTRQKEIPISKLYSLNYEYEEGTLEDELAMDYDLEQEIIKKETEKEVRYVLAKLKPSYQELMKKHFGIGCKEHKIRELAKEYNCSYQNIYIMYDKAKKHFIKEWRKYENSRSKK